MFKYILVALLVVLVVCLIYWVFYYDHDQARRKRAARLLIESVGVFDAAAREALKETNRITNPRAIDHFRSGNILRYNLREGRHDNRRYRDWIATEYINTLTQLVREPLTDGANNDFMLHNIEEFGGNIANQLTEEELQDQILLGFFDAIHNNVPAARKDIVEARAADAQATAKNRAEAVNIALDSATKYTSDSQNVHDSCVNKDLRETLRKLKQSASNTKLDAGQCIDEAIEYINDTYARDTARSTKAQNALRVLNTVRQGTPISTFADTEDRIFAYTWKRCEHPNNAGNEDKMREAVVNALADSIENGNQVCINGRTSHILNSLATLDYDPALGSAMTFEAYRNQIFQETKDIINNEIENAKASADDKLRAVGEAYETGDVSADTAADAQFKESIKTRIDNNVDTYKDKLSDNDRDNIKQECYVYATL